MTKRIFRSILTVSIAVLLACLVLIVGVLHGYFEDRVQEELQYRSTYIAQGIALKGIDYLNGLNSESRITWIAADGTVLYDNREDAAAMENHSDRDEVREALQTGEGHSSRYSHTLSEKTIYYAVRLSDGTVLRVSDTQYSVWILVLQVLQPVAIVMLLAIILALLLSSRVSKQIVKPINGIDLTNPGDDEAYEELTPFIARIRSQNRQINWQMSQLRRRQEEFAAITENMGEGFLVIDRRTNVLSYNSAALHLLDAAEPPKGTEVSVYTLNRESGFRRAVEDSLNERRSEQMMEKDGRCRQVIASPVFQEDNTLAGAVLVILDITEKEQRESLRREFTANVSHELKTPLTSILGTAEIMQNGLVRAEDIPHFAGNIHREASRLIELVNDIIKLSRLDEGGPAAEWESVDLYSMSASVIEQLKLAAEKKQVTVELRGGPAAVRGVPQIVEEIVYNLCDNAVKYNRNGGSVTITTEEQGEHSVLTVSDTGIGIPPEARSRIFERFYRVDKSHSAGGTGLGLSIVKHGAAYLGATIACRSEVDSGSVFTVTFPRDAG